MNNVGVDIRSKMIVFRQLLERLYDSEAQSILDAVVLLHKASWEGRQIFVLGNGGSASTAQHFAADLCKWASEYSATGFKARFLGENLPWATAIINDVGWEHVYVEQLKQWFHTGDLLVIFSVHGGMVSSQQGKDSLMWSGNLLKAVEYIKKAGGSVISFSGYGGGALREVSDVCIVAPVEITVKENTPYVESMHSFLAHLIVDVLREVMACEQGSLS